MRIIFRGIKNQKIQGDQMAINIKVQRDYLKTEVSVDPKVSVSEVDELLKATKTNGKLVVLYNEGHVQGINVEQNTRLSEPKSVKVRELLAVNDEVL